MEKRITPEDILAMERIARIHFMNTVSGIKGVHLVGTQGHRGTPNLAVFNSVVHVSAAPPHLGLIIRPLTVPRHTYHNIKAKGFFTINHIHGGIVKRAHQTSANYGEGVSEFEACDLEPQYTDTHPAPYVAQSRIKIGLEVVEEHRLQANDSIFVVGKVVEILLPENSIEPSGHVDPAAYGSVAVAGLDTYYRVEQLLRMAYARPGEAPGVFGEGKKK